MWMLKEIQGPWLSSSKRFVCFAGPAASWYIRRWMVSRVWKKRKILPKAVGSGEPRMAGPWLLLSGHREWWRPWVWRVLSISTKSFECASYVAVIHGLLCFHCFCHAALLADALKCTYPLLEANGIHHLTIYSCPTSFHSLPLAGVACLPDRAYITARLVQDVV